MISNNLKFVSILYTFLGKYRLFDITKKKNRSYATNQ